jgi:hypothetical protein
MTGKGREMKLIVAGLSILGLTLAASSAGAATSPAGQVESLRVDPAAASHGAAVEATVGFANPGDKRSKKADLLLKLRAPDGESGLLLTSKPIGKLKAGETRTVALTATIPDDAPSGDSTLVACRAKKGSADACGVSRQTAPLRVLTPATLRISPGAHAFESHATGTTSPTRTFTVTNNGETASEPIATSITGANPDQFTKSADGCEGRALAGGESCELNAAFSPTETGAKSAGLRASASGSSATAALTGTGVAPARLTISPSPHGFGAHATGTTSGAQTFTITNTGGATSGAIAISLAGADPGQFTKSNDTCNGQTLAPGQSCTVDGAFAPAAVGAKNADLQATASPGGTATATLNGTGATPANLTVSPSPHGFGTQLTNTTSLAHTFTVTNTGGVPSGTIATSLAGANPDQFTKSTDTCNGQTLGAGQSCTVDGAFAPTSSGAKTASLQAAATPGGTASSTLTGTGQTPANLTLSPTSHNFGNVLQGTDSAPREFTLTNTGEQTATFTAIALGTAKFTFAGHTCSGGSLPGGASCAISVAFHPGATDTGTFTDSLTVSGGVGGSPSASLSGTAVATAADLDISFTSPAATSPGTYGNSASATSNVVPPGIFARRVWIRNAGAADAHLSSPVPLTLNSARAIVDSATCPVVTSNNFVSQITFTDTTFEGNSECYFDLSVGGTQAGTPFSASFTITGTPGGSITGTISGSG